MSRALLPSELRVLLLSLILFPVVAWAVVLTTFETLPDWPMGFSIRPDVPVPGDTFTEFTEYVAFFVHQQRLTIGNSI